MSRIKFPPCVLSGERPVAANRQRVRGIGLAVSVGWRKYGRRYYRFPVCRAGSCTLTVHAPAVAERGGDAFDEDDMPLPRCMFCWSDVELNVIVARSVLETGEQRGCRDDRQGGAGDVRAGRNTTVGLTGYSATHRI